jgi:hypothetical protein
MKRQLYGPSDALAMSSGPPAAGRHKPAHPSSGAFGNLRDGGAAAARRRLDRGP